MSETPDPEVATEKSEKTEKTEKATSPSPEKDAPEKKTKEEKKKDDKITVVLRNVGNVPILARQRYNVDGNKTVKWMANWIQEKLKNNLNRDDRIILYVSQCFAPPLDQHVANLYDCFGVNDKLVVQYAAQPAWG